MKYCGSTRLQKKLLAWLPFQFACYVHDLFYEYHMTSRLKADLIFLFVILSTTNCHLLGYIVFIAVRLFGNKYYKKGKTYANNYQS